MLNLRSILSDKSIIALLSLAAMIPMMTGKIDLTVGYGIVLWHILAIALQIQLGPALAGGGRAGRPGPGLPLRPGQRPPRRGRPDRQLHRHARHRHRHLRRRALVHRRPPGDRRPAAGLLPASTARSLLGMPIAAFYVLAIARRALDRHRVPADRPLSLRHRRQPARRRAQRHPDPPLRDRRLHGLGRCSPPSPA